LSKSYKDTELEVGGHKIPLRIYIERRRNITFSLGKKNVLMRIPIFETTQLSKHIENVSNWLLGLIKKDASLIAQYNVEFYQQKQELKILEKDTLYLDFEEHNSNQATLKSSGNNLKILLPEILDGFEKKAIVRKLLSRYLVKRYKGFVQERIEYWNKKYFNKEISSIVIRDNNSNWGSCSVNRKISISTRSLLLPMKIFDYIIVHELSHLVEMNHSYKFWDVVKKVMPDYEDSESWIRKNGSKTNL
jgi:predicted metal-dependent hydrolase